CQFDLSTRRQKC
nr:Chain E, L10Q meditope [synthetic construct]5FF6_F Chain F, L10Q meditope [synthetic construct]